MFLEDLNFRDVVYRPFPTSNHNPEVRVLHHVKLYIVRFLHQTTTAIGSTYTFERLYIVRFLHQTTTFLVLMQIFQCCISSVSYIKPQLRLLSPAVGAVVYRPFPTSNHNRCLFIQLAHGLYIVRFLHQTTTNDLHFTPYKSCISSVSYIKPQLIGLTDAVVIVVYRPFPTSNHNQQTAFVA